MERFSHRESVLLGYSPRRSLTYSSSPRTPHRTSDLDFNDVFGGPPRRSSMQDKLSFSETTEFSGEGDDDEQLSCMRLGEKPVFGEENVNRRRYPSDVFFDDIFRGDESLSSTPRKRGKDPFASSPGSRVLSPARPLPPKVEPFGSSSMLPKFSLPAKSAEGMEFEDFGSTARTPSKFKDGASGGISFSYASSPALSRFSSQAIHSQEESGNDVQSCHCQPPLSQEVFLSREELLSSMKSDERNTEVIMKKEPDSSEIPSDSSQFHFSIYKWASKGVPLPMPFRGGSGSRTKDPMKFERYSRWNIRIAGNKSRVSPTKSSRTEGNRQENDSNLGMNAQDVTEVVLPTPESETPSSLQNLVEHPPGNATSQDMKKETKPQSMPVIDFCDKAEKEFTVVTEEVRRPASKTLYSLFSDNNYEQGDNDVTEKTADKESTVKSSKTPSSVVDASKNESKQDGKRITMNGIEAHKATFQDSPIHPGANLGRKGVKGKVKEFVKIFSQETSPKPKDDVGSRRQGSNWTKGGTYGEGNKQSIGATGLDENIPTVHVNSTTPGSFVKTDEHLKQPEKEHSATKTTNHIFTDTLSRQKENSSSSTVSTPSGSKATVEDKYELFQANFLIKELNHGEKELPESGDNHEEIQGIDVKIRQWSDGKKGNIRSLLSTLQYVLWPQSGWKPVPLVDIIEGNSVKRAYQKALLCLHPDKLQQKGAASNQKYTAEKVFEILQEAWDHFNSLGS